MNGIRARFVLPPCGRLVCSGTWQRSIRIHRYWCLAHPVKRRHGQPPTRRWRGDNCIWHSRLGQSLSAHASHRPQHTRHGPLYPLWTVTRVDKGHRLIYAYRFINSYLISIHDHQNTRPYNQPHHHRRRIGLRPCQQPTCVMPGSARLARPINVPGVVPTTTTKLLAPSTGGVVLRDGT